MAQKDSLEFRSKVLKRLEKPVNRKQLLLLSRRERVEYEIQT